MSRDWKPVVITTKPGEGPAPAAPEGTIDVTPETLGDRSAVASINEFRDRLEASRQEERARPRRAHRPDDGPEAA